MLADRVATIQARVYSVCTVSSHEREYSEWSIYQIYCEDTKTKIRAGEDTGALYLISLLDRI